MAALLMGVEKTVNIVARGRIYEMLYLSRRNENRPLDNDLPKIAADCLRKNLRMLYKATLEFIVEAQKFYNRGSFARALSGALTPDAVGNLVKRMQDLEADIIKDVENYKNTCNKELSERLEPLLEILDHLEEIKKIGNIDSTVTKLLQNVGIERRTKVLNWISSVPYESNHNTAYRGHTPGTGEWLLEHNVYQNWHLSGDSRILWLHGIRKNPQCFCLFLFCGLPQF